MKAQDIEDKDFIIQIKGLQNGKHEYEFPIDGAFFKKNGNTQILDASITAKITLEKGSGWMNVVGFVNGSVTVECDRCLDELVLPMNFNASLAVKFAKTDADPQSDEFLIVDPSEGELDISQFIYDYVCLNLPLQTVHKENECNPLMLEKLKVVAADSGEEKKNSAGNTPFEALDQLIKNKK